MSQAIDPVIAAQQAAEAAQQAAIAARDGAEIEFLSTVTSLKQIADGRTQFETNRLKSRYIAVFGLPKWTALCARR
jgi:hypothetical protein